MKRFHSAVALVFAASLLTPLATAKEGAVQCGNLIYAGTKTSTCFSDEFLSSVQQHTSIATERRFSPVKLSSEELFEFPFVIMTGEGDFVLTASERENLVAYLKNGGFLLASAGCSSEEWRAAFEREIKRAFGKDSLKDLPRDHAVYNTVFEVEELLLYKASGEATLQGLTINDKIVCIYSSNGLNDTAHTEGCCCCGGSEIRNSLQVNANILAYALLH